MSRVTGIRRRRPGDSAVDVVLDSGDVLRVHDRRIAEHRLSAGKELGAAGVDALRRAAAADDAERRALRLIARRPRSEGELRARIAGWGVDEATAAGVVARLRELGQLDDRRFAIAVTEARRERGYGRLRTAHDLARLAVDEPAAAAALDTLPCDERPDAERIAVERFGPQPYDDRTARRAAAFLTRRGFDVEAVAAAMGRPWT